MLSFLGVRERSRTIGGSVNADNEGRFPMPPPPGSPGAGSPPRETTPAGRLSRRQLLTVAAGLGLTVAAGPLAGCSSSVSISQDPDELVLWYWNRSISPRFLDQAAQQIPGTSKRLRADVIGGTFDTKLRTSLAGNAYIPDITAVNSNASLYFTNEDLFIDLNTLRERARTRLLRLEVAARHDTHRPDVLLADGHRTDRPLLPQRPVRQGGAAFGSR